MLLTDIYVHKDGSVTDIVTDGATIAINFDGITGNHLVTIDTSAHADYSLGSEYAVRIEGATVDGGNINAWIGAFSIERAGGVLALLKATTLASIKAETALIVADTNELQVDDVPGLIATAQTDLDTLTGSDGATLATAQGNYAPLKPTTAGRTLDVTVTGEAGLDLDNTSGTWAAAQFAAAFITASKFGVGAIDALAIATDAVDEIVDGVWDELLIGGTHNIATSAGRRLRQLQESGSVYNGQVYLDTVNGVAGTTAYENGTTDNPVDLIASAKTIAASVGGGLHDFHIINGSTVLLFEATTNESYFGDNWILQLGGQNVAGAYFQGAHVSGVGVSAAEVHYEGCDVATMSVQLGHFDFCSFSGTVTQTLAGDYNYHNCYSMLAGPGGPTFAKTAGQTITAQWRNWSGSINITGLELNDTLTISGQMGTIDLGSPAAAAVVEIRGTYKEITNAGSAALNLDGAILAADVAEILVDTADIQPNYATSTALATAQATIDAVETDTNELQIDWVDGGRLDLLLDAVLADTNELQLDDVPGLIAALNNLSVANVLTQVNAGLDASVAELAGVPSATASIREMLMFVFMGLRNKHDTTSASDEVHNDAGAVIATAVLSDDTITYIKAEYA